MSEHLEAHLGPVSAPVAHQLADVGGVRLHLLHFGGTGRPLLLLHGVGGSAWLWHGLGPDLAGAGTVVAMDLRGYGPSQWPGGEHCTTADHARDVGAVAAALGWDEFDVVGFSWGALVGLAVAASGAPVRRLVMIDLPPASGRSDTDIPGFEDDFASLADAVAAQQQAAPNAIPDLVALYAGFGTRPEPGGRLRRDHDPFFLQRWLFRNDDRWDELAAVTQPILVVRAANSPILAPDTAAAMVAAARGARLVEIPDTGHLIPLEQPAALTAAILDFLQEPAP